MKGSLLRVAAGLLAVTATLGADAPPSVPVRTSRGEFQVLLYRPATPDPDKPLVFMISGEGGWRAFDVRLSQILSEAGYWVGGMDATKYFWDPQDDRQALASDVRAYVAALAASAGRPPDTPVVLAGFSFGADLAPWIAGAGGWDERVAALVMVGPDTTGSLQFRILEILGFEEAEHVFSVAEALRSAAGIPIVLVHGEKDAESAAPALEARAPQPKRLVVIPGADHHFSGRTEELRRELLAALGWALSPHGGARSDRRREP